MMNQPPDTPRPRYRLYIDESGDHTYNRMDEAAHRYLALLGVWFREVDDYVAFADGLERFKRGIFGPRPDKPVVLHRSDIINRKGAFGLLCRPDVCARFDAGLLEAISAASFHMACVVIDKQAHRDKEQNPFHPYHYCLAALLDRYTGWLNYKNAVGDVLAESRGREEDLQLKEAYRRVYESGTLTLSHEHHQRALTSKDIKLRDKRANIAGLQLADVLAYPVKQALLVETGRIPAPAENFGRLIYTAAEGKFNAHTTRGPDGYGKVWL